MVDGIFDSHAHYDDDAFDADRDGLLRSLASHGVRRVMNVGSSMESSRTGIQLGKEYDFLYSSVGVHPDSAREICDETLRELAEFAREPKVRALGEIGLDYHYEDNCPREIQIPAFERQLALAKELDIPVIIHTREAVNDTLALLKKYQPRGIVHCFSGSVEMAKKYNVNLEVLSSMTGAEGTIVKEVTDVEKLLIKGVTKDVNIARISAMGVSDQPGIAFRLFSLLAKHKVSVDIILQSVGRDGTQDISFTVAAKDADEVVRLLEERKDTLGLKSVICDPNVAKVSIVGAGMETHAGVASKMFEALGEANINIQMIATSEIKISVLIAEEEANKAVAAIHRAFYGE